MITSVGEHTPWAIAERRRTQELAFYRDVVERVTTAIFESNATSIKALSDAQIAQAQVMETWLKGFATSGPTYATIIREEDEAKAEMEREAKELQEMAAMHINPRELMSYFGQVAVPDEDLN